MSRGGRRQVQQLQQRVISAILATGMEYCASIGVGVALRSHNA